jgi:AbrB family looped-hinge helix DNA binding protein
MNQAALAISSVTVSADLQITIPAAVGKSLGLSEGQRFQIVRYQDRIELIPIRPMPSLRGFLKGMNTNLDRDADRL